MPDLFVARSIGSVEANAIWTPANIPGENFGRITEINFARISGGIHEGFSGWNACTNIRRNLSFTERFYEVIIDRNSIGVSVENSEGIPKTILKDYLN